MLNKKLLKKELDKRNKDSSIGRVIGSEMRSVRMSRSLTIKFVCNDICDPSYLCKIEKGEIVPNQRMLKELFSRLDIKTDKVDVLSKIGPKTYEALDTLLTDDEVKLEVLYNECSSFQNFRARMICLIYNIKKNKMYLALDNCSELDLLISTFSDEDLMIYILLKGLVAYYESSFKDCLDCLNVTRKSENILIKRLSLLYIFYASYKLNSRNIHFDYIAVLESFEHSSYLKVTDLINYLYALHLIQNGIYEKAKMLIEGINDNTLFYTAREYCKFKENDKYNFSIKDLAKVRDFFKLIIIYKLRNEDYPLYLADLLNSRDVEYNCLAFQYIGIDTNEARYRFIESVIIKKLTSSYDGYLAEYIKDELNYLSNELGRYKLLSKILSITEGK